MNSQPNLLRLPPSGSMAIDLFAPDNPMYTSFIDIFGDNVSGNWSKNWNKHWNTYITHQNLPRKLLNQQASIHFVSTSTHASVPEQFQGIKEIIEWVVFNLQTVRSLIESRGTHHTPVKVRNASNGLQMRFRIYCNCALRDNSSQSETSGHIGGNRNHPCRKCELSGTQKVWETDNGFHASFSVCTVNLEPHPLYYRGLPRK